MTDAKLWRDLDRPRVVRMCAAISGSRQAADDLAQETLLEAWRIRARLRDPSGLDAWLAAIARNVCRRWARSQGRELRSTPLEVVLAEPRAEVDLDAELEREEMAALIDRALGALPAASRDVMRQRYLADRSVGEIAQRSGATSDAISMRLARGKAALRRLLSGELRDEAEALGMAPSEAGSWRHTRVHCTQCGVGTLQMRIEPPPGSIAFRCPRCDPSPSALAMVFPLSNPGFARLLHGLVRPTGILRRAEAWTQSYYAAGVESGRVECSQCGAALTMRTYDRDDLPPAMERRGLYVDCPACKLQISSSAGALTLAQPQAHAFRQQHPRLRSVPSREIEAHGGPALVVGYRAMGSNARLDAVFAADSLRLLEVYAPSPTAA